MEIKSFDEIAEMWRSDRAAAEAYHRAVIDDYILGLPDDKQERARRMQWRIDQELSKPKYKDPLARLNRMVEMMWESFFDLDSALHDGIDALKERPKAKVLTLQPRKDI